MAVGPEPRSLVAPDHARQWRNIRLSAYKDFLSAYREYIAFTVEPAAKIFTEPHPTFEVS